ncbi:E3 ubiquitin-protein ligase DZIP3 [Stylophora pistillata]|uniref:E3 ubiquitin-protein ligase DZIP3 n=2 Tax=Stylophora pistillata TaxID=50429 RepID=A0A2B4SFM7_STYPI|nr:E3 ubiquitin-protein ligase DZIP3 [Stylophora pistillata]
MASATPSALVSSVEKTNGAKLSRLLIDGGTTVLRCIFDSCHPPGSLSASFTANYSTLNILLRKRILHRSQWDLLFPPSGAPPDSQTFDITLLFLLLTKICGLSPPHSGWHCKPPPSDSSLEANLARIKFYRNELYGHVTTTGIADPTFSTLWQEISAVLVALGLQQAEIDRLRAEYCGEQEFIVALLEWADTEEDIKSQLKEIRLAQTKVHQITSDVHKTQLQDHRAIRESNSRLEYIRQTQLEDHRTLQDSKAKLDEARRTQLEDSNAIQDTRSKVDEVCERLKTLKEEFQQNIDDLKGESKKQGDDEILRRLAKVDTLHDVRHHANRYLNGTRLSIFAEVERWLGDEGCSNRVMVISGNAGMGKSVISAVVCEKMLKAGRLLGSHFCKHNVARRRNPKVMLQSLACQLSDSLPEYKAALVDKLSRNLGDDINSMEVRDLFELLFEEPLCGINDPGITYLVVMDGLDESEYQGRNDLLDVISSYFKKLPLWIRFLITTRPELNIADRLKGLLPLRLEPSQEENMSDIHLCFKEKLTHLSQYGNREILLKELVAKSEGIMLYAHYLVDFLNKDVPTTHELMQSTLPAGISSVYQCYFERLEKNLREQLEIKEDQFLNFLGAVAVTYEPLPLGFVSKLLLSAGNSSSADQRKLRKAITCISNLLPIENECIHFFHKSIKDWLIDNSSYGHHSFSLVQTECHNILAQLCIDELDEMKRKGVRSALFSDTAKYALQHGVTHMLESNEDRWELNLEEVITKYVLDLELVYAKLCVNSSVASEDILRVQRQQHLMNSDSFDKCDRMIELKTLLLQLRKYNNMLTEFPQALFQTLLNDGGSTLSYEAMNLLETKFPEFSYMEYLHKND